GGRAHGAPVGVGRGAGRSAAHRGHPAALGLLQQGRDHLGGVRRAAPAAAARGARVPGGVHDRGLHGPALPQDLLRALPRLARGPAPPAGVAVVDDGPAGRARSALRGRRVPADPAPPRARAGAAARGRGAVADAGARGRTRGGWPRFRLRRVRDHADGAGADRGGARRALCPRAGQVARRRALRRRGGAAAARPRGGLRPHRRSGADRRRGQRGGVGGRRDERAVAARADRQRAAVRPVVPRRGGGAHGVLRVAVMGLLSDMVLLPLVGAGVVALLPRGAPAGGRGAGLAPGTAAGGLSVRVATRFATGSGDLQLVERVEWIREFGVSYALGIDGISLLLVLLTTFLTPLVLLAACADVHQRQKEFFAFFLVL